MAGAAESVQQVQKETPPARADESPARTEARDRVAKDKEDLNQKLKDKAPTAEVHGVKHRLQTDRTYKNHEDVKQKIKEDQRAKAEGSTPQSH
jgi:hypothetical protein